MLSDRHTTEKKREMAKDLLLTKLLLFPDILVILHFGSNFSSN